MSAYDDYLEKYNAENEREFIRRHPFTPMKPSHRDIYEKLETAIDRLDRILRKMDDETQIAEATESLRTGTDALKTAIDSQQQTEGTK